MLTTEPLPTAIFLAVSGALLIVSVIFSRATERFPVPVTLVFLAIGVLAGSEGIGGIVFEDYRLAYRLGMIALVLILFDGGLNTSLDAVRRVAAPAAVLATIGVLGIAGLLAVFAHSIGLGWPASLLIGAVVSSTDAAAVFAVLRASGVHLQRRVAATLEVESGSNDPMAVILTVVVTQALLGGGRDAFGWPMAMTIAVQIVIGLGAGLGIGFVISALMSRARPPSGGLLAVMMIGAAFLAFAIPTLMSGSGLLSVYVTGIILGNGRMPYKAALLRIQDALAWLSQVTMFLVLGLLVFPSRLIEIAPVGLLIAAFLTIVARPVVVTLCLVPFRYTRREIAYISAVGLRGAVPIVLASFPVLAGAPGASRVFDIVFFVVLVGAFIPGSLVSWLAGKLHVERSEPPAARAVMAIESMEELDGELLSFYVDEALPVTGATLREVPFPVGAAVTLIVRSRKLVAPERDTVLLPGDHVYVITTPAARDLVQLLFGRPEAHH